MFKALILSLALVSGLHADVKNTTPVQNLNWGVGGSSYGSLTYALNNGLTGTSSSAIDLSGTSGLWLTLTSTASCNVLVYFSNASAVYNTGAIQAYILQSPGSYPIFPINRYVSFYNAGTTPTNRVSAAYYTVAPSVGSFTGTFTNGTVTAYQGTSPWSVSGVVTQGSGSAAGYGTSNPWIVNAAGFRFLSATVKSTGLTTNADTVISLTWAASTTVGPIFVDLGCAGSTGLNFLITNAAATPSGFVANSGLFGYQPCGQISQIPLEVAAEDTPHLHAVAVTLSNTSGALGLVTKIRY